MSNQNHLQPFPDELKLLNALGAELQAVVELQKEVEPNLGGRLMTRSLFSLLDAYSFFLKSRALISHNYAQTEFTQKELRFLNEGENVVQNGVEKWQPFLPGVKENLRSSIRLYSKVRGVGTPLGGSIPLPPEFEHALKLRTRVTHPKRLSELEISRVDAVALAAVVQWFLAIQVWTTDQELAFIEQTRKNINESINAQIESFKKRGA